MDWWIPLLIIIGSLLICMLSGFPTAFCFLLVNMVGVYLLWGGETGFSQLILSIRTSITKFALVPLVLFVLMGSILFESGIASLMVNTINKWLGRLPGRLSLVAIVAGTVFATLSGSSQASTAMLGSVLVPEMEKHGYKKPMTLGPIMGAGGLAMMIPPSGLGVFIAVMSEISVGKFLISIIVPGLIMAVFFATYILMRCSLQPDLAPIYRVSGFPMSEKLWDLLKYVLPLALIVFLVTGVIILGIATPSEAAATGCLGTFILAAAYGKLNWKVVNNSTRAAIRVSAMTLIIMGSSAAFSQILAFTGANEGLVNFIIDLKLAPIVSVIGIQILIAIMGCFMPVAGILMIILPLFVPVVNALNLDPIWFAAITLLNAEMAGLTPPFGTSLFVMKGVAPRDTTMEDVYKAAMPFVALDILVMILMLAFPVLTTWLPGITAGK